MRRFSDRTLLRWACLLFALMGLVPPWVYTFNPPGASPTTQPAGYYLLVEPPSPRSDNYLHGVRIDYARLAVQWAVLVAGTTGVVVLRRVKPK